MLVKPQCNAQTMHRIGGGDARGGLRVQRGVGDGSGLTLLTLPSVCPPARQPNHRVPIDWGYPVRVPTLYPPCDGAGSYFAHLLRLLRHRRTAVCAYASNTPASSASLGTA